MRLLVDTNIFLEILLEQNRAEEAKDLLRKVDQHDFFILISRCTQSVCYSYVNENPKSSALFSPI